MRIIQPSQLEQIERTLGRPLSDEELVGATTLPALSDVARSVAGRLVGESRILAVMYLQELVQGTPISEAMSFLDRVIESGADAGEWARSRGPAPTPTKKVLARVGFFRELKSGSPDDPSLKDSVRASGGPDEPRLVRYLQAGKVLMASPGIVRDVLDPQARIIGSLEIRTDGTYAWRSDLAHYVEEYHVVLPAEFLAHAQANGWNVPTSLDVAHLELEQASHHNQGGRI